MQNAAEKLKDKGLKVTPQRIAIYDLLSHTDTHPTVEAIHKALYSSHPSMSLATVYKTLNTFKEAGLSEEFNVGEESFRYDANTNPHHHMICTCCHKVYDIPLLSSLDGIEKELRKRTDFNVTATKLYFYGVCRNCV